MEPQAISDELFKACLNAMPEFQVVHKTYVGPTVNIGDLETIVSRNEITQRIHSFWKPTEEELKQLNAGGAVELIIWADHLHPVGMVAWGGTNDQS